MLKKEVLDSINDQINAEFYSAYLYLSMSAFFQDKGLSGFANWMMIQFQEEQSHAMKFFNYINERGGKVELKAVEAVPTDFDSILAVWEQTLAHEQMVTETVSIK